MNTSIRLGNSPFYGDQTFNHGLSRSGYFNKRESDELIQYGQAFSALTNGLATPDNEEEQQFVLDMHSAEISTLYAVRLWKKYLNAVEKSRIHHGFAKSNGRFQHIAGNVDFA